MRLCTVFCLLLMAGIGGCTASKAIEGDTERVEAQESPEYLRRIAPFSVMDEAGQPYDFPFLGGLNVPRPQFVDIDADRDLDLFVQEVTGQLMYFENIGTPEAADFVWRTDRYQGLDIGEWNRFADFDGDGDMDLIAEQPYSYVRYFRNEGTPLVPHFKLAVDSLRDQDGAPLFFDRQNIPNLVDLDCDGQLDLFLGRVDGTVMRYEWRRMDADNLPRFELVNPRFEDIEIIGQVVGIKHGANTLSFEDYDDDGDPDLFWGDFFEPGLLVINNTGSCANPSLQGEPQPFPDDDPVQTSGYNAPIFGDLDGDGDRDLLLGVLGGAFNPNLTSRDNLYLLERDGSSYELQTRRFLNGIDLGNESIPTFADLDGDGDQDLYVSNKIEPEDLDTARMYVFENTGTAQAPVFALGAPMPLEPGYHYAPAFGDLDGDGDLDVLMGGWKDEIALYRNYGTPTDPQFVVENMIYVEITRGSNTTPALVDIDADGDLDLFIGESSGALNYYENTGTSQDPAFVLVSDQYADLDVGRRSVPRFVDLDGDQDFDLILGREDGGLVQYENTGTPQVPAWTERGVMAVDAPAFATPAFVDIDGDGDMDLFSGSMGGGVLFFEKQ